MFARRLLPGTAALAAFEAAARLGSFTRAAAELNLTQGAISRHVAQLEAQLGVALFHRVRQRIGLTPAGRYFAEQAREVLSRLAQASARTIAFDSGGGTLDLAILPTFGARWLMPRLPDFFARHRDISINFSTRVRPFDLRAEGIDAAILSGAPTAPGLVCLRFLGEELVPVAAPALAECVHAPADLLHLPLLLQETRLDGWDRWFRTQGLQRGTDQPALVFEQFLLVIRAAVAGLGCALVPSILVQDEIDSGELRLLPGQRPDGSGGYHLVYPPERDAYGPLAAFRSWLLEAAGASARAAPA